MELAYLTDDIPGISLSFKERPEDFVVEEVPAYEASGEGDHVYCWIEKTGVSTHRAVQQIASYLKTEPMRIGIAGLKDAQAVTRQMMSIEHVDPAHVQAMQIPGIRVLSVNRHRNKLRIGHLRANRFIIKLRGAQSGAYEQIKIVLMHLEKRGIPNYFGPQRFGARNDSGQIGKAFIQKDYFEMASIIAGRPREDEHAGVRAARMLFDQGEYARAADEWPRDFKQCMKIARVMAKTQGNARKAIFTLEKKWIWFFINAYQSELFNRVLSARLNIFDQIQTGDLAFKHTNGAVFLVEDAAVEQPRVQNFEISPSGPLFGFDMIQPCGEIQKLEHEVLDAEGLKPEDFYRPGSLKCAGARRPLRIQLENPEVENGSDVHGDYVELRFSLDRGTYATAVLREIIKNDAK